MKSVISAVFAALFGLSAAAYAQSGSSSGAANQSAPAQAQSVKGIDASMRAAARDFAGKRKALAQEFRSKRQELTGGADWKTLTPAERRAKLKALQADFKAQQRQLRAGYAAQRRAFVAQRRAAVRAARARRRQAVQQNRDDASAQGSAPSRSGEEGSDLPPRQPPHAVSAVRGLGAPGRGGHR